MQAMTITFLGSIGQFKADMLNLKLACLAQATFS
jgi:hypothetical protein